MAIGNRILNQSEAARVDLSRFDAEKINRPTITFWQGAWRRMRKNPIAIISMVLLGILIFFMLFGPAIADKDYITINAKLKNQSPNAENWFGTDALGRDLFSRIWLGCRLSLLVALVCSFIQIVVGCAYGGTMAYCGGVVDMVMMRIIDIIYAVPSLIYVVLILLVFGDSIGSMMLAICLTSWIGMARQVRAQVMSLKEMEFSLAAKVIGASDRRILLKHLIVNALGPIIVSLTMMVPGAIFTESFLSFVGIGLNPAIPSWGKLANDCRALVFTQPIQIIWPVGAICLTILALNFVGDGIGEAFQARTR